MKNKVTPTLVSEIKLTYKSRVKAQDRPQIISSLDAYTIFRNYWDEDTIELFEEFHILLVDRANRVMGYYPASKGSMVGTLVDVRMIFAAAIKARAVGIILAHNHPSNHLKPSQADLETTNKVREAGKIMDIHILDHIILAPEGGYYSFADEGLM